MMIPPKINNTLGGLAARFRGTRDETERTKIIGYYREAILDAVQNGDFMGRPWDECPAPEDQLPTEHMPPEFFEYWSKHGQS